MNNLKLFRVYNGMQADCGVHRLVFAEDIREATVLVSLMFPDWIKSRPLEAEEVSMLGGVEVEEYEG